MQTLRTASLSMSLLGPRPFAWHIFKAGDRVATYSQEHELEGTSDHD